MWRRSGVLAATLAVMAALAPAAMGQGGPFDAAVIAYDRGDYKLARRDWEQALRDGDWEAARSLGHLYRRGLGVDRNPARAAEYYQTAFDHGVVNAGLNLAELYIAGDGVPQDLDKATRVLRRAADQGSELAEFRLRDIRAAGQPGNGTFVSREASLASPAADGNPPAVEASRKLRLASYRSRSDADRGWLTYKRPDLRPEVVEADQPGGSHVYRLYATGPDDALAGLCADLEAKGQRCRFR